MCEGLTDGLQELLELLFATKKVDVAKRGYMSKITVITVTTL